MSLTYYLKPKDLISPAYARLQMELHGRPRGYGGKGDKWAPAVRDLIARFDAGSVLDYGAGGRTLGKTLRQMELGVRIDEYDPGVPGLEAWPVFADLVVCTDVLEHVEPEKLETVLRHLDVLFRKALFVVIATRPSNKTLEDGRNAHLIVQAGAWWAEQFTRLGLIVRPGPVESTARQWVAVITR